jgi:Ni/Co efflux regulator RcnB
MRLAALLAVAGAAGALALAARAASVVDFDHWMHEVDKRTVDVQQNIQARRVDAALADARELARLYGLMEDYFAADGHYEPAVTWSRAGKEQAQAISRLLAAQDYDGAVKSAAAISHACDECHDQYKPFP